jgi:uncharacterized membrane protein
MRLLLILLSLILLPSTVGAVAYSFSDYTIDVTLEDSSLREEISFTIKNEGKDPISWVEYDLISMPEGLEVSDEEGSLNYLTETPRRVIIQLRSPLMEGEMERITMSFAVEGIVVRYEDKSILTLSYIPETGIAGFKFVVRLPPRSTLASEVKKTGESISSVYPVPSRIHSDGKRIIVEWFEEGLLAHEEFRIFLMYTTTEDERERLPAATAGIAVGLILGLSIAYYYFGRRPAKEREVARLVLGEDEKKIYDLLISHDGKILQDDIAKNTDFSRAKISKLVRRLEEKGIIKKEPYRKTNRLLLKKEFGGRY